MSHPFRLVALASEVFDPLRGLSDADLQARGARRMRVDETPGYPCRVTLEDAAPGEEVILTPYTHHDVTSPYRASGPIFVRVNARTARPDVNEVPAMIRSRLLSIRAYDDAGMMLESEVAQGIELERHVDRFFRDPRVRYLHLHNARPGCYNCRVDRA